MVCWGLVAALRDPPANERRGVILHPRWGRAFPLWVSGCHRQRSKCSRHLPLLHRDVGCGCRCARGGWAVRAGGGGWMGGGMPAAADDWPCLMGLARHTTPHYMAATVPDADICETHRTPTVVGYTKETGHRGGGGGGG